MYNTKLLILTRAGHVGQTNLFVGSKASSQLSMLYVQMMFEGEMTSHWQIAIRITMLMLGYSTRVLANDILLMQYVSSDDQTFLEATNFVPTTIVDKTLERGSGLLAVSDGLFTSSGWESGSFSDAVTNNEVMFCGFSLRNDITRKVQLTELAMGFVVDNTGPAQVEVRASVNGAASVPVLTYDSATDVSPVTGDLSTLLELAANDAVIFTVAGFSATDADGTLSLENSVEPGSIAVAFYGQVIEDSMAPSLSPMPSMAPSGAPSAAPTFKPTVAPTPSPVTIGVSLLLSSAALVVYVVSLVGIVAGRVATVF